MSHDPNDSIYDVSFAIFDLETTGLDYHSHNIIEIGAVKSVNEKVVGTFQSFVKISGEIPPDATTVNGITNEMISGSPPITEVLKNFLHFLGDSVLVAHNIGFDYRFLNSELLRNNMNSLEGKLLVDTLEVAKKALPSLSRYSLEVITSYLGINVDIHHRALDDAMACKEVLYKCCEEMSMLGELALSEILVA